MILLLSRGLLRHFSAVIRMGFVHVFDCRHHDLGKVRENYFGFYENDKVGLSISILTRSLFRRYCRRVNEESHSRGVGAEELSTIWRLIHGGDVAVEA